MEETTSFFALTHDKVYKDSDIVQIDAGGLKTYTTRVDTLAKSAYFRAMLGLNGGKPSELRNGSFFVDCTPYAFNIMLEVLRTGHLPIGNELTQPLSSVYLRSLFNIYDIPYSFKTKKDWFSDLQCTLNQVCIDRLSQDHKVYIYFIDNGSSSKVKTDVEVFRGDIHVTSDSSTNRTITKRLLSSSALSTTLPKFFLEVAQKSESKGLVLDIRLGKDHSVKLSEEDPTDD